MNGVYIGGDIVISFSPRLLGEFFFLDNLI